MSTAPHDAVPVVLPDPDPDVEPEPALGAVVEQGHGSLPYALIHGEALVACASWALGDAGITAVDLGTGWEGVADAGEPFVLHDALCPMTPASFLAACVRAAVERDAVVVGVRPVTDTVKAADDGVLGETLDRDALLAVASPVVLPASVVAAWAAEPGESSPDAPGGSDGLARWVADLAARYPVVTVEAPPEARRVTTLDEVRLLEALTGKG